MTKTQWWCVSIAAGGIAVFLDFDGPFRASNWMRQNKTIAKPFHSETQWIADPKVSLLAENIVALTIEQTGCYGTCPVYIFRLERSKRAFYDGKEFVSRKGRYTGKSYYFDSLAYFAAERLLSIRDDYWIGVTDHSTTILTIEMTDGKKRISNYANAGPNDLSIFCAALDGVESSIEWIPEKTTNQ